MKHQTSLFLFIIAFVLPHLGWSQSDSVRYISIAGRIQDQESKEALGGVRIVNQTRNAEVLSKANGFYSIVGAPGDIIRFSSVGYEPEYMRLNDTGSSKATVMIYMNPDDYYIEEVIVSLPSESELNDYFMSLDVDEDLNQSIAEQNPETFNILDNIKEPPPGGPVSFLKDKVFDKMKQKKKKPKAAKKIPKYKN